uniref:Uncharacterized protein n=1 Tax=Sphaerodactylus townsendi TaxID=933632 RepID=A0ACB8EHS5_9SAUR
MEQSSRSSLEAGGGAPKYPHVPRLVRLCTGGSIVNPFAKLILAEIISKGLVFVAHGAGEHCCRYDDLAQMLTGINLFVFAHDHGRAIDSVETKAV